MDISYPKHKPLRIPNYDYSQCNIYFLTLCTKDRQHLFWSVEATCGRPQMNLSLAGRLVAVELEQIPQIYKSVRIETYCIMPDHIHLLLSIDADAEGRPQVAPTVSRVVQQFKGAVSKRIGQPIWQKSFYDHIVRNEADYLACWQYIENNPLKYEVKSCL